MRQVCAVGYPVPSVPCQGEGDAVGQWGAGCVPPSHSSQPGRVSQRCSWNGGCPVGSPARLQGQRLPQPLQEAVRTQQSGAVQGHPRAVSGQLEQLCDCAEPAAALQVCMHACSHTLRVRG